MSMTLMVKAMTLKIGSPIRKLVLIKLADNANDKGECWPSYQHIADQCELSRSAVRKHIKQLEKDGFLTVENRKGEKGNSSNLYHLRLHPVSRENTPCATSDHTLCHEVTPEPVNEPVKEPVNESKDILSPQAPKFNFKKELLLLGADHDCLEDWLRARKKKRAANTQTALKNFLSEVDKSGLTLNQVLEICAANSWSGFKASWDYDGKRANVFSSTTQQNIDNLRDW